MEKQILMGVNQSKDGMTMSTDEKLFEFIDMNDAILNELE
jgi:hypothetical protein